MVSLVSTIWLNNFKNIILVFAISRINFEGLVFVSGNGVGNDQNEVKAINLKKIGFSDFLMVRLIKVWTHIYTYLSI